MPVWWMKTRRAPSRHCRDTRVYDINTTAKHEISTPPILPPVPLRQCQVTDLQVSLVDSNGNDATLPTRGVKIIVGTRDDGTSPGSSSSLNTPSRGGGGRKNSAAATAAAAAAAAAKKDLSKRATHDPVVVMPRFVLDSKLQDSSSSRGAGSPPGVSPSGRGAAQRAAAAVAAAAAERATKIAEEGLELVVRVEGGPDLEGVQEVRLLVFRGGG